MRNNKNTTLGGVALLLSIASFILAVTALVATFIRGGFL